MERMGLSDRLVGVGAWLLVGWTVFLWISRLRNVLADDDLTGSGRAIRIGIVVVFVALAGWAGWSWHRSRSRGPMLVLIAWTVGFWLVRGIGMLVDDHTVGFKVVHTVLWGVSTASAYLAWRRVNPVMQQSVPGPERCATG